MDSGYGTMEHILAILTKSHPFHHAIPYSVVLGYEPIKTIHIYHEIQLG